MLSTTEAILDVNVVIASIFEEHEHHKIARQFVEKLEHFYTCPTVQGGFLRFATRPMNGFPPWLSMREAQETLSEFSAAEGHHLIPDNQCFTTIACERLTGHKQWTDAYLLKLAEVHRMPLATIDSRMRGICKERDWLVVITD